MAPVKRNVMNPSAVLRILVYSLLAAPGVTRTLNPQNDADRVKGVSGPNCHLCPRPARAGEAVTTPPSTQNSAPSATITLSRLSVVNAIVFGLSCFTFAMLIGRSIFVVLSVFGAVSLAAGVMAASG